MLARRYGLTFRDIWTMPRWVLDLHLIDAARDLHAEAQGVSDGSR